MSAKAVIFDLDGTLVESLPGITEALNLTFAEYQLAPRDQAEVRDYIGDGLWVMLRRAMNAEQTSQYDDAFIDEMQEPFQKHYHQVWKQGTYVFEGVSELICSLNERGVVVGVLSNKKHDATVDVVEFLFGRDQVSVIYGQRDGVAKKPDPAPLLALCEELQLSPNEVCYVGDSTIDLETAKGAGTQGVGVTWGYHDRDRLVPFGYELCDDVASLKEVLKNLK